MNVDSIAEFSDRIMSCVVIYEIFISYKDV